MSESDRKCVYHLPPAVDCVTDVFQVIVSNRFTGWHVIKCTQHRIVTVFRYLYGLLTDDESLNLLHFQRFENGNSIKIHPIYDGRKISRNICRSYKHICWYIFLMNLLKVRQTFYLSCQAGHIIYERIKTDITTYRKKWTKQCNSNVFSTLNPNTRYIPKIFR